MLGNLHNRAKASCHSRSESTAAASNIAMLLRRHDGGDDIDFQQ